MPDPFKIGMKPQKRGKVGTTASLTLEKYNGGRCFQWK
jgi:hypothetical protein